MKAADGEPAATVNPDSVRIECGRRPLPAAGQNEAPPRPLSLSTPPLGGVFRRFGCGSGAEICPATGSRPRATRRLAPCPLIPSPKSARNINRASVSRICVIAVAPRPVVVRCCGLSDGGWYFYSISSAPAIREAAVPEDRVLSRASGAEGVCGLLAVGYHYPRRNRGHARVPVSVLTDVTGGG